MSMIIKSYDESYYQGDYEFVSNPEHDKKPEGSGWYMTEKGWARGSNRKDHSSKGNGEEHVPTKAISHRKIILHPSKPLLDSLVSKSRKLADFVSRGIVNCFAASKEVIGKTGFNHRDAYRDIDDLILGFADKKKPQVAHVLSAYLGYRHHLSPDFRNEGKPIPKFDSGIMERLDDYIQREQEIIRMSGIVNEDDTVTLFRNTDETQIAVNKTTLNGYGYKGNNIESWTTNPDLTWSPDGKQRMKVMAKVPLSACVASCIGRDRPFMFKNKGECEIMVCGAFVHQVLCVGNEKMTVHNGLSSYYNDVKRNIIRFVTSTVSSRNASDISKDTFHVRIANELLRIAQMLLDAE